MRKFILIVLLVLSAFYFVRHVITSGKAQNFLDDRREYAAVQKIQYLLGEVFYDQGEYAKTIKHFDKFYTFYPGTTYKKERIDYIVACCHDFLYHRVEAKERFRKYLEDYPHTSKKRLILTKLQLLDN